MKIVYAPCALVLLAACPHRSLAELPPTTAGTQTKNIPVSADIDILFVIDNSLSTADKQALFAQNFPAFVDVLDTQFGMGRPNLHIAVVSTTVGTESSAMLAGCPSAPTDDGAFQAAMVGSDAACSQCAVDGSDRFLSDVATATGRTTNYSCPGTNPLAVALPCMAELGTAGCGFEAPLEAMKRALDGSQPGNTGFVRDGAYLAVVILTDEDDCSINYDKGGAAIFSLNPADVGGTSDFRCQPMYAYRCDRAISAVGDGNVHDYTGCVPLSGSASPYLQDTSYYYNALTTIKDPSQLVVAVIGGTDANGNMPDPTGFSIATGPVQVPGQTQVQDPALEPSCMATVNGHPAIARPGLRLADFVSQFGERGKYYSVCQSDYTPALRDIGERLFAAISPCLEGPIDTTDADPNNPGLQPQCTVSYLFDFGTPQQHEQELAPCIMTDPTTPSSQPSPCWYVVTDPTTCADPSTLPTHLELKVANGPTPPAGTMTSVSCAVASP